MNNSIFIPMYDDSGGSIYPSSTKAKISKQLVADGYSNPRYSGKTITDKTITDDKGKVIRRPGFYCN